MLSKVTISGSYRKFPEEVGQALEKFSDLGVKVLSPKSAIILSSVEGFVSLQGDPISRINQIAESNLTEAMRLVENGHLKEIQQSDALWLILQDGYCGLATAFEVGWALAHQVPVFYEEKYFSQVKEPILRSYSNPTASIEYLVANFSSYPKVDPVVAKYFLRSLISEQSQIEKITQPEFQQKFNANIAVGPVIVDESEKKYKSGQARDILVVKTHKWGNRYSIVGGKIKSGEKLSQAFSRIVKEQTGLDGIVGDDICCFDELPDSGYFKQGSARIFIDKTFSVNKRAVHLDYRAQEYLWIPPAVALQELDLEPNAQKTIEHYNTNLQH